MKGETMYIRVCEGLKDKGKLIPVGEDVLKHVNPDRDYYVSVFEYNEAQKKQFEEKGTIAGITDVSTHKLYFDFDSTNFEEARRDTIEIVSRLRKHGIQDDAIKVYFSGSKGTHVIVQTKQNITPQQMKSAAMKLAANLKTLDTSIYNASRILRVTGTKHGKSGLYKTELSIDELQNSPLDDIKKIASEPYIENTVIQVELPKTIQDMLVEKKKDEVTIKTNDVDMTKNPLHLTPWKLALFHGYFPAGNRSNAMMILAATLKAKGLDRETAVAMLKVTAQKQAARFKQDVFDNDELEYNIIDQVYGPTWLGKTYSEDSFPLALQEYLVANGFQRMNTEKSRVFESTGEVFSNFDSFAKNIDANTIKTGIPQLDQAVTITTSMLVGILGAPSSGKTLWSMNMLELISKSNEKAAFFSMDMSSPLVYQRMIQKVTGYSSDKIKKIFKENNEIEIKKIKYQVDQSYNNIDFSFKTALTPENIREAIIQRQEETGQKYRLVIVDYLECVHSDFSDPTQRAAYVAQTMKDIANDLGVCVLLLLQPTKVSGTPKDPLDSYAKIRGSGNISAACSIIISLWREGFSPRTADQDKFITFGVLKNRLGGLAQLDFGFDGLTGQIYELDEAEKQELDELRQRNRAERNNTGGFGS